MRTITIDPRHATPIWRQIADQVHHQVGGGLLAAGDPLPSVRDLAVQLRVNPATVARAYRALVDVEVVEVRRGEGTFVAAARSSDTEGVRRRELDQQAQAYARVARSLGFDQRSSREALERAWRGAEHGQDGASKKGTAT
ncbi:MAG: GntR family transcriptional regulator [Acidobacteria bacterium]|nr:MAG: GntR family transcriptional regulator [Acidobacteriota bacterium]REK01022.1 MAG: GntR family transcriptional regulator [Acidobacteriota bacterium]